MLDKKDKYINDVDSKELSHDILQKVSGGISETIDIELDKRIMSIISEQCDLNMIINPCSNLVIDLQLDSLEIVDLIQALEEEFKISISDASIYSFITVQDIINYISDRVNTK